MRRDERYTEGMKVRQKMRRTAVVLVFLLSFVAILTNHPNMRQLVVDNDTDASVVTTPPPVGSAAAILETLAVKGRAPKTDYTRAQFGNGWSTSGVCDTRNIILHRDMPGAQVDDACKVVKGELHDPYTGQMIAFVRGPVTSQAVQIDHVVALSNAWQTGAQQLTRAQRVALANDPLELLAVDGAANQQKSDGDAATWLPSNKVFRCQYVARQIAVKQKYGLWVTPAEKEAMKRVLVACPDQLLPKH